MIFKSQIVYSVALTSVVSATQTPGPFPSAAASNVYQFGTANDVGAGRDEKMAAVQTTLADNSVVSSGFYNCLRNGSKAIVPQKIGDTLAAASGAVNANDYYRSVDATADAKYVYGLTTADVGTVVDNNTFPNGELLKWTDPANVDLDARYVECCSGTNLDFAADSDIKKCSSYVTRYEDNSDVANDTYGTTAKNYVIPGRVALGKGVYVLANADNNAGASVVQGINEDFILAATGQLSDNVSGTNFCSNVLTANNFFESTSDNTTLVGKKDLSNKTKCTWQIVSKGDILSKIELTHAENLNFMLQWVEFTVDSGDDANTTPLLVAGTGLATAFDSDMIGDAKAKWISPFTDDALTLSFPIYTGDKQFQQDDGTYADGSIGPVTMYRNAELSDSAEYTDVDSSVILGDYEAAKALFATYEASTVKYTEDLKKYNDAVLDMNAIIKGEKESEKEIEEDLKELPARPMPPKAPNAWTGMTINTNPDFALNDTYITGTGKAVAVRTDSNTDLAGVWGDSRRFGYASVYNDDQDIKLTKGFSGHAFGRFGADVDNLDTIKGARMANTADNSAYHNYMQISIFPEYEFEALTEDEGIKIAVKAVEMDDFAAPAPISFTEGKVEVLEGASALVASTMALATLTYTLF